MDPVANLNEQVALAKRIMLITDHGDYTRLTGDEVHELEEISRELSELALAMDKWRRNGGFDPYTLPFHNSTKETK